MSGIFISYRRSDAAGHAGRIYDRLVQADPRSKIFMDVDSLAPGTHFPQAIRSALEASNVFLCLIGRSWLSASDAGGQRRLDSPQDFVRLEVEAALASDIKVIPLLVQGATLPSPDELPPSLRPLLERNALEVSDERWAYDMDRLTRAIQGPATLPGAATDRRNRMQWITASLAVTALLTVVGLVGKGPLAFMSAVGESRSETSSLDPEAPTAADDEVSAARSSVPTVSSMKVHSSGCMDTGEYVSRRAAEECEVYYAETFGGGLSLEGQTTPSRPGQRVLLTYKPVGGVRWERFGSAKDPDAAFYLLHGKPTLAVDATRRWFASFDIQATELAELPADCGLGCSRGLWHIRAVFPEQGRYERSVAKVTVYFAFGD